MAGTATVYTEGAQIAYDYEGTGPLLLTIAGAGGDGMRYADLSHVLADRYTVVRYDRRGNGRSTGDLSADLDMAQSARDAAAVIRALGAERACIFGNSGGANIALKLAEDAPELVATVVAHEPPVAALLPDGEQWQALTHRIYETYRTEGGPAAIRLFIGSLTGLDLGTAEMRSGVGAGPTMEFFLAHELLPISSYRPDLERIARNRVGLVTAAGRLSGDAYYARTARLIAERLPCRYVEFPGHHLSFMSEPAAFAAALREALADGAS